MLSAWVHFALLRTGPTTRRFSTSSVNAASSYHPSRCNRKAIIFDVMPVAAVHSVIFQTSRS